MTKDIDTQIDELLYEYRDDYDKWQAEPRKHPNGIQLQDKAKQSIKALIADAERGGAVNELIKIAAWGETVDDQWNDHFRERMIELTNQKEGE